MNDYNPLSSWNEAVKRQDEERKRTCDRINEKWKIKIEKEKIEQQKGRKK